MLDDQPYSIHLYLSIADCYSDLGYPDLAVGAAYKALLLADALEDDCDEYYESAFNAVVEFVSTQDRGTRLQVLDKHAELREGVELDDSKSTDQTMPQPEEDEVMIWVHEHFLPMV